MSNRPRYCALVLASLLTCASTAYADGNAANNGKLSVDDSSFLQHAAQDGMANAQLGQMALDKSSDPKIKELAQQLVDQQGKTTDQLKTLAQGKQVTLPTDLTSDAQKQAKTLQSKKGSAFDEAWSKAVAGDHQQSVKTFTQESKQGKDDDVKKFAADALPALNSRMKTAKQLAAVPEARDSAMDDAMKAAASPMTTVSSGAPGGSTITTPAETAAESSLKH